MRNLKFIRRFLPQKQYLILGVFLVISQMLSATSSIYAQDDYPYKDSTPGVVDVWGFYTRNCTSFVAWRMNRDYGTTSAPYYFYNTMQGPNGNSGTWGNANNWDNNAAYIGFEVNNTPVKGAIAVWEAGVGGAGAYGHVAYVESVNSNGTVNISEYNWNWGDSNYNYRTGVTASHYVHVNDKFLCGDLGGRTLAAGTYEVTCNIYVNSGASLHIMPGVTLDYKGFSFTVNGSLIWGP